ncbi:phage tail protein [Mammaliicoccus sciuri]
MLYVTDLNSNTEPLNHIQRVEINEEVNGAYTLALTSFFHDNNPGHQLLEEESIIHADGFEFRVKQIRTDKNRKEIIAFSTFFDLIGHRQDEIYGGTRTLQEFMNFVFKDTGWNVTTDINESRFIPNFGEGNVPDLLNNLLAEFECEYKIMPGKHVHFSKEVGPDNDAQYRYGHNIKELSHFVDTYNLRTQITGYGDEGLVVTYTSPYAEKYGIRKADPITDDEIRTESEMIELLKKELNDYPETSIALDSVELSDKEVGERVWLIYEPIRLSDGTFMEFQTRVMKKTSVLRDNEFVTQSVVIGNAMPRSLQDMIAEAEIEIERNAKWTRSRIEQTNYKIELAVERFEGEVLEAYSKIELTADEIRSEVGALNVQLLEGIAQNKSLITQTATQIRSEVTSEVTRVDGRISSANSSITQLAGRVDLKAESSTVSSLGSRVNNVEFSLDATNAQISQKVSQADYTGRMITSMINQDPYAVSIHASKIDLVGAVTVLSDISGNLGSITSGNINIWESAYIGSGLYLRGGAGGLYTGIYFGRNQIMEDSSGWLNINGGIRSQGAFTEVHGTIDFSKANVIGLK